MSKESSIRLLLEEIKKIISPLSVFLSNENILEEQGIEYFFDSFDVDLSKYPVKAEIFNEFNVEFTNAIDSISEMLDSGEKLDELSLLKLFPSFLKLFQSFELLDNFELEGDIDASLKVLGKRILDSLLLEYCKYEQPKVLALANFIGAIGSGSLSIQWDQFIGFLKNPFQSIKKHYASNENGYKRDLLLYNLHELLNNFHIPSYIYIPGNSHLSFYFSEDDNSDVYSLRVPLCQWISDTNGYTEAGVSALFPDGDNQDESLPILSIGFYGSGALSNVLILDNGWRATFQSSVEAINEFCIEIQPEGIKPTSFISENLPGVRLKFTIENREKKPKPNPILNLLGTSLTLDNPGLQLELDWHSKEKLEFTLALILNNLGFSFDTSKGDSFINKILPASNLNFELDLVAGYSSKEGFFLQGSGGLEVTIPIHKKVGPINVQNLDLLLSLKDYENIAAEIRASFSAKLGPISANINKIGLGVGLGFGAGGNLGILDLSGPSFLPPTGAGLAIQAGVINGGGYLDFDPDNERYAGILALKLGSFDLTAIGLITTRMPDGSKGFSLLVSIGVVFMPPIQLSYGFTLSGVGGLLGVNRRMVVEKIQDGLSEGSIDSIMFPVNAIENADRIISDLRAIFPPAEGQFVIAPFVKIGWGTPNIIQVDLGIFLEFPFKGRIILIGKLAAILPNPEKAILQLQVDVFGNFDFANERILILGALRDSYLYEYPLSGEFGFLLSWGQEKAFLLSAGGFHPRYQPPAGFPALKPIRLDISKGKFHIAASCYHAITANSFQFGARAELLADYDSVKMTGVLSFDTFLQFKPFGFTADMGLKVDVRFKGHKLAGADMNLALSGPAPWVASGTATFSIWIWDKDVDFYESWGGEPTGAIEAIDAWEYRLKPALESNDSWGFYLPLGTTQLALLKPLTEDKEKDTIYLPPNASLEIRQQALPLEADLEQLGNAPIAGSNRFAISGITIGGVEVDMKNTEPVKEYFARGQFFKLSDSEKLSTPAFDPMKAGVRIKPPIPNIVGRATNYDPGYENILIGENLLAERDGIGTAADRSNAQTRRTLHRKKWRNLPVGERMKQSLQAQVPGNQVQKQAETSSVQADGERLATFETYTEAAQYVRAHSDGADSFKIVRK